MRHSVLALATACVLALAGCGSDEPEVEGDLDATAQTACDETARYAADGFPKEGRDEVLSSIAEAAKASDIEEVANAGALVEAAIGGSPTAHEIPLDTLAATCMDLGWEGANGK